MDYRLIVLGATALASSAMEAGEGILTVERGTVMAPEYCQAFLSPEQSVPQTMQGRALHEELRERGLLIGQRLHLPPVSDVLAVRALNSGASVWLGTETLDIRPCTHGFEIDLFAPDGLHTVTAERLIDSTGRGFRDCGRELSNFRREIRVPLLKEDGHFPDLPEGVHVEFGPLDGETVLCVSADRDAAWSDLRTRLKNVWHEMRNRKTGWLLAGEPTGETLIYDAPVRAEIMKGWLFMPSASLGSLTAAYEEGIRCV